MVTELGAGKFVHGAFADGVISKNDWEEKNGKVNAWYFGCSGFLSSHKCEQAFWDTGITKTFIVVLPLLAYERDTLMNFVPSLTS